MWTRFGVVLGTLWLLLVPQVLGLEEFNLIEYQQQVKVKKEYGSSVQYGGSVKKVEGTVYGSKVGVGYQGSAYSGNVYGGGTYGGKTHHGKPNPIPPNNPDKKPEESVPAFDRVYGRHFSVLPPEGRKGRLKVPGRCAMFGFSHIVTFDQASYTFPNEGEYKLAAFGDKGHIYDEVHVLLEPLRSRRAYRATGVSFRSSHDRIYVRLVNQKLVTVFNGKRTTLKNIGPFTIHENGAWPKDLEYYKFFKKYSIELQSTSGSVLKLTFRSWGGQLGIGIEITFPGRSLTHTSGLCGLYDSNKKNDIPNPSSAASLVVSAAETSLFCVCPGEDPTVLLELGSSAEPSAETECVSPPIPAIAPATSTPDVLVNLPGVNDTHVDEARRLCEMVPDDLSRECLYEYVAGSGPEVVTVMREVDKFLSDDVQIAIVSPVCLQEDVVMGEWSNWGQCSQDCGGGVEARKKNIMDSGGNNCGSLIENRACNTQKCVKQDCKVSFWNPWTNCTDGKQHKNRTILQPDAHGGAPCPHLYEERTCQPNEDCKLGNWSDWTMCTNNLQERRRPVLIPPSGEGKPCDIRSQTQSCKTCQVSAWSNWSACGPAGIRARQRIIVTPPLGVGDELQCGSLKQEENCVPPVDCEVSSWSNWSTCRNGHQQRSRTITKPAQGEGSSCPNVTETRPCLEPNATQPTPNNTQPTTPCQLTSWSSWSVCQNGEQSRTRSIVHQSAMCKDSKLKEVQKCNTHPSTSPEKACDCSNKIDCVCEGSPKKTIVVPTQPAQLISNTPCACDSSHVPDHCHQSCSRSVTSDASSTFSSQLSSSSSSSAANKKDKGDGKLPTLKQQFGDLSGNENTGLDVLSDRLKNLRKMVARKMLARVLGMPENSLMPPTVPAVKAAMQILNKYPVPQQELQKEMGGDKDESSADSGEDKSSGDSESESSEEASGDNQMTLSSSAEVVSETILRPQTEVAPRFAEVTPKGLSGDKTTPMQPREVAGYPGGIHLNKLSVSPNIGDSGKPEPLKDNGRLKQPAAIKGQDEGCGVGCVLTKSESDTTPESEANTKSEGEAPRFAEVTPKGLSGDKTTPIQPREVAGYPGDIHLNKLSVYPNIGDSGKPEPLKDNGRLKQPAAIKGQDEGCGVGCVLTKSEADTESETNTPRFAEVTPKGLSGDKTTRIQPREVAGYPGDIHLNKLSVSPNIGESGKPEPLKDDGRLKQPAAIKGQDEGCGVGCVLTKSEVDTESETNTPRFVEVTPKGLSGDRTTPIQPREVAGYPGDIHLNKLSVSPNIGESGKPEPLKDDGRLKQPAAIEGQDEGCGVGCVLTKNEE